MPSLTRRATENMGGSLEQRPRAFASCIRTAHDRVTAERPKFERSWKFRVYEFNKLAAFFDLFPKGKRGEERLVCQIVDIGVGRGRTAQLNGIQKTAMHIHQRHDLACRAVLAGYLA